MFEVHKWSINLDKFLLAVSYPAVNIPRSIRLMRFIKCRILTRLWITVYNILFTILFEIPFFKTILTPLFNLFYKPFCWVIIWYLNVIAISFCECVCMFLDRRKTVLVWRIKFNLVFLSLCLFLFSKCVFILNKVDIGGKFLGWKSLVFGNIFYNFHYIPVALSLNGFVETYAFGNMMYKWWYTHDVHITAHLTCGLQQSITMHNQVHELSQSQLW